MVDPKFLWLGCALILRSKCTCHDQLVKWPVPGWSGPPSLWAAAGTPGVPVTHWTSAQGSEPAPPHGCTGWSLSPLHHCMSGKDKPHSLISDNTKTSCEHTVVGFLREFVHSVYLRSSQWGYFRSLSFLSLARMAPPSLCRLTNRLSSSTSLIRVLWSIMHCCTFCLK